MGRRIFTGLVAGALTFAVIGAPQIANAADSAGATPTTAPAAAVSTSTTGALTVMLMTTSKQKLAMNNAAVTIRNETGYTRTGATSASGRATFSKLPPGDHWMVRAEQPDGAGIWTRLPGVKWGVSVTAGEHIWVALVMRLGGAITGKVRDEQRVPVENALVTAVGEDVRITVTTRTDAAGHYELVGLPLSDYDVSFSRGAGFPEVHQWWKSRPQYGSIPRTVVKYNDIIVDKNFTLVGVVWRGSTPNLPNFTAGKVTLLNTDTGAYLDTRLDAYNGTEFRRTLEAGNYKLKIEGLLASGEKKAYWYTGDGTRPSGDPAKAVVVHFTGTKKVVIDFNFMV